MDEDRGHQMIILEVLDAYRDAAWRYQRASDRPVEERDKLYAEARACLDRLRGLIDRYVKMEPADTEVGEPIEEEPARRPEMD